MRMSNHKDNNDNDNDCDDDDEGEFVSMRTFIILS